MLGNHDHDTEGLHDAGFTSMCIAAVCATDPPLALSHLPVRRVPPTAVNVHGHIHAGKTPSRRHFNVSVERTDYAAEGCRRPELPRMAGVRRVRFPPQPDIRARDHTDRTARRAGQGAERRPAAAGVHRRVHWTREEPAHQVRLARRRSFPSRRPWARASRADWVCSAAPVRR